MEVTFHEYYHKLLDQAVFNISCMASVKDTEYEYFAQDDFRVRKPDIKLSIQGEPVAHREVDVIVRLTNPLPIPLKKGTFQIEGPGLDKQLSFKVSSLSPIKNKKIVHLYINSILFCRRYPKFQFWGPLRPHLDMCHHILAEVHSLPNFIQKN